MMTSNDRITVSVAEMCAMIGVGLSTGKAMLSRGEIPSFLASARRRVVPRAEIEAWVARRLAEQRPFLETTRDFV